MTDPRDATIAELRAFLELRPEGYVGPDKVPWFSHGCVSHAEGANCIVCKTLATPTSSRFLDLDAPDAGKRLNDAMWRMLRADGRGSHLYPEDANAVIEQLKEDRREPGDTG